MTQMEMRMTEVNFASSGALLSGTVWRPDGQVRTPGLVMVGGSGATDRRNGGYFDVLRRRLVAAGIAVLGYDKRGVGRSTGRWADANVDDLAADAAAAVELLRQQSTVDANAVGVFGHSEGGWVALRVCAGATRACHLVLNSCPAVTFLDAEAHALHVGGVDMDVARTVYEQLREAAHAGHDHQAAHQILHGQADPAFNSALDHAGFELDDAAWAQLCAWIDYDPTQDLKRLVTPTLALYGEQDPLTPIQDSVRRLHRVAPSAQTRVFAGADHRIQINGQLAPGYLAIVTAWCRGR